MVKFDERYCIFPPHPGQFGVYIQFDPKEEKETDPHIRLISIRKVRNKIVLNKSVVQPHVINSINQTKRLNRQMRFVADITPELIRKLAEFYAEKMGSTEALEHPIVQKMGEGIKEKKITDDVDRYSEFK